MVLSFRKVAENLNISLGTTYNVCQLFEETGCIGPKCTSLESNKLFNQQQELWIMGIIVDNPSLYLGEICQKNSLAFNITVSLSTICQLIHRHSFTCKRIQQVAFQRSSEHRAAFMASI